jgi:hypothetical protein
VRHHLLLLNSLLIHTSLGIVWSFRNHCISVEILVWTSKAMAQFADSGSTNCEIPLPAKIFSFGVVLYGPESWCGESCHSELFSCSCISLISLCIASIVLLLDWVFLTFQRPFFLLVVGLQVFLFLSAAAVFSAELFLFLCLCLRHHYHITIFMCLLFYRLFWDVWCLLSSCSLESLKFCSPFLVCDVRRFRSERDSIVFVMVVVFLIGFSGSVLLRSLLRWHCELFSAETRWVPMLGVRKNRMKSPNTKVQNSDCTNHESSRKGTRNPRKFMLVSKVVNPFTRALAPLL